ncbi:hypothetical protein SBADM41S_11812 [Streptomyces badius]
MRVSPSPRSPTDSSAAESTWACAPSIAATASAGAAKGDTGVAAAGWRRWRASRRAFAPAQVTGTGADAVAGDRVVIPRT